MKKLVIIDTSVYCVWLDIPNMNTCQDQTNQKLLTQKEVKEKIENFIANAYQIVLPFAVIIETGNHISQIQHKEKRIEIAHFFVQHIQKALEGNSPWIAFENQNALFEKENLEMMLQNWQKTVQWDGKASSLADVSIAQVKYFYEEAGYEVDIFSCDWGLLFYHFDHQKANKPKKTTLVARRKK